MKISIATLFVLAACGDNMPPDVHVLEAVDAGIDAATVLLDACTHEPSIGACCSLLPDEGAARACVESEAPPGSCGVMVCWSADCSQVQIHFCAPGGEP